MPTIAAEPYAYNFPAGRLALIVIDMQRDFVEEGGFGSVLGNDVRPLARIVPTVRRLIDGFRAGMIGWSDSTPLFGAIAIAVLDLVLFVLCWRLFATGWKLKA